MMPSGQLGDRLGWSTAAVLLISAAIGIGTTASPLLLLAGLVSLLWVWMGRGSPSSLLQLSILGSLALTFVAAGMQDVAGHASGSDEVAFVGQGARMVLQGLNPYAHVLALPLGQVSGATPRLDGTVVHSLTYPALSFLVYVPFELAGLGSRSVPVADLLAWIGAALLLWRMAPLGVRWISGLFLGVPIFAAAAVGSTDAMFLPLLMMAVWRWDRYGDPDEEGPARWLGPVALGAAMAVKQQPWLFLPFLLAGVGIEARRRGSGVGGVMARYLLTAGAAFLAPNLPFLLAAPRQWVTDVLAPLVQPLVPNGTGLVATLTARGGVDLRLLTVASGAFLVMSLAALFAFYDRLKTCWPMLVSLAFFWATRSLAMYFLDLLPVALVAVLTVRPGGRWISRRLSPRLSVGVGALASVFLGSLVAALATPPPLRLSVDWVHANPETGVVDTAIVSVTNSTGLDLSPWFNVGGAGASTWTAETLDGRPVGRLPAHSTSRIRLVPPAAGILPGPGAPVVVDAYVSHPAGMAWARYAAAGDGIDTAVPATLREPATP